MKWLATMSPVRAILIALAWPALFYALPAIMMLWVRVSNWIGANSGAESFTQTFVVLERGTGPRLWALLLVYGPSLVFLIVWWFWRNQPHRAQ
jgi:hypothetical protein